VPLQPEKFVASLTTLTTTEDSPKLALAAEVLASGHTLRLRAFGTSMLPSIWPGDILSVEPKTEQEIVPGDIVLVAKRNRFFIHRLIEKQDSRWITRGDSLPDNDDPVNSCDVLGRVSLIHKNNTMTVPSQRRPLLSRALAWTLCHCDSFRSLALRLHSSRQNGSEGEDSCSAGIPSARSGQALPAVARASCLRP
jgi:signal peptidase I